jgi:hypothetical protein
LDKKGKKQDPVMKQVLAYQAKKAAASKKSPPTNFNH